MITSELPTLLLASSLVPGLIIFFIGEQRHKLRGAFNIGSAGLNLALVLSMLVGVSKGQIFESRFSLMPGVDLVLHADAMSLLFVTLSISLWLLTTIYAIGYLEQTAHRSRFFGFFSLCVCATVGVALAGNMLTLLLFYELLTLVTYPLLLHRGTAEALAAGRTYLIYTLSGGAVLLLAVVWLRTLAGPLDFRAGGILAEGDISNNSQRILFGLFVLGFGVKAGLVPLHGWLPKAMVAPAPVSALLHAVAVVKAGAFGLVRVSYDVFGIEHAQALGVLPPLSIIAAATILWGSYRALQQTELKKRLAFSTVSQVSYIILGIALLGPLGTVGGLVHIVHQGVMKITLFFCAGNYAEKYGIHRISEMNGVGRHMPLTTAAFTIAALGMIGMPPIAGFISKWYLATGAMQGGQTWILAVLALSTLLNAAYFLPIVHAAWFGESSLRASDSSTPKPLFKEAHWMLLLPPVFTAALSISFGIGAGLSISPLSWAHFISSLEYMK